MKQKLLCLTWALAHMAAIAAPVGINVSTDGKVNGIIEYESTQETITMPHIDHDAYGNGDEVAFIPIEVQSDAETSDLYIDELEQLEEIDFILKDCSLGAAIKLCANACGMSYIAPPNKAPFDEIISLDIRSNPFRVLKLLCKTYNVGVEHNDEIWQFYGINLNELIQKTYKLRYNTHEQFKITPPSVNSTLNQANSAAAGTSSSSSGDVFSIKTSTIVEEIQRMLDLPTTGIQALESPEDTDNSAQARIGGTAAPKANILYNPYNNELVIVATRQQHSYIENSLKSLDQPQRLIQIQTLLVETSRNPQSELGVDWSAASGARLSLNGLSTDKLNLNKSVSGALWPYATLSASDMAVTLNFLKTDSNSSIAQDPTVVSMNNREVSLKSVIQQPIESSNAVDTTLSSKTNVSSIDYVEIGTIINIHPKIMDDHTSQNAAKAVHLNVSLVVSSEIGKQIINRKEYPIISSRTYNYSVIVRSGETLAIGGLSESYSSTMDKKVPILCEIPLIGAAFRSKSDIKKKRNLVAYITPTIIN